MSASAACCRLASLCLCVLNTHGTVPTAGGSLAMASVSCCEEAPVSFLQLLRKSSLAVIFLSDFCVNLKMRDKWKANRKRRQIEGKMCRLLFMIMGGYY